MHRYCTGGSKAHVKYTVFSACVCFASVKIILKEREERKQNRMLEERGLVPSSESTPVIAPEEPCETADTAQEQLEDSAGQSPIQPQGMLY